MNDNFDAGWGSEFPFLPDDWVGAGDDLHFTDPPFDWTPQDTFGFRPDESAFDFSLADAQARDFFDRAYQSIAEFRGESAQNIGAWDGEGSLRGPFENHGDAVRYARRVVAHTEIYIEQLGEHFEGDFEELYYVLVLGSI